MRTIWAVARQTFSQCLRMKIAVALIVLLAALLGLLPTILRGDNTLAGSIRTALSYGVSLSSGLLSIVMLLVAVAVVAGDVQDKTIHLLIAKPLARWKYLLGRWIGVVMLGGLLLGTAGGSVYLLAQYLREQPADDPIDRGVVETEVFTARQAVRPTPPDVQAEVQRRIDQLKTDQRYDEILATFRAEGSRRGLEPEQRLLTELTNQARSRFETAGPGRAIQWTFENIKPRGQSVTGVGKVELARADLRRFRIAAGSEIIGRMIFQGPVEINGFPARVARKDITNFDIIFSEEQAKRTEIRDLAVGDEVEILLQPMLQFRYEVKPIGGRAEKLWRVLQFGPLEGAVMYQVIGQTDLREPVTVTVPVEGIADAKGMGVRYVNAGPPPQMTGGIPQRPPSVQIVGEDVSVLYRVGSFGGNFLRAMLLIFFQLAFLAAMGVFFGSFLSFSVATMASLVLLVASWPMTWLDESLKWSGSGLDVLGKATVTTLSLLMPGLGRTSPADLLVDGIYISWGQVGMALAVVLILRAGAYLALGCLIFHKRELARVQV
jgi:hypothetical protein